MLQNKLRVAVLYGGNSKEAIISERSANNIVQQINELGHEVIAIDFWPEALPQLISFKPDVVYNTMHGKYGEDGCVQCILEFLSIPYTGSGVLASAISMDKDIAKTLFTAEGILTPKSFVLKRILCIDDRFNGIISEVDGKILSELSGYPCIIKPTSSGSTVGINIVKRKEDLSGAISLAMAEEGDVLIEQFISGKEITVAVYGNSHPVALPVIEIIMEGEILDWDKKYTKGLTQHVIPANLSNKLTEECQHIAIRCHEVLKCKGCSRTDMILTGTNEIYVLELNSIPGMTDTSFFPDALKHSGTEFKEFVRFMLDDAIKNADK